ncbi:MAG: hypothetical protein WAQ25_01270 [Candidatus Saccharimonas sp.]
MVKAKKTVNYTKAWYALAVSRIMLGFVFLWAFLDKTMGLGLATPHGKAWLDGVSPTSGFLLKGVNPNSPSAEFFHGLAGNVLIDWLFMLGLLGIGMALILGIGLRIAAIAGSMLLMMMWAAEMPLKNNPLVDDHMVYTVLLWVIALAPRKLSLIDTWLQTPTVKKNPWLW